jgi:hypothetical protein
VSWDHDLERRLRAKYCRPCPIPPGRDSSLSEPTATRAGDGFLTEIAGKLILTAPARNLSVADDLPESMREKWERASAANPYYQWVQGRFVEAERANRNGAYWSTADLQFGEMSVRNGPLNWLHQARKVVGTIADNKLITPEPIKYPINSASLTVASDDDNVNVVWNGMPTSMQPITFGGGHIEIAAARPYIAAVSAVWKWIYPEEANTIEAASDAGTLYYSMECVAKEMSCVSDDGREGCGQSFPYMTAMTDPSAVCEHIRHRTSARRMVDPAFLGGAVIVPPVQPGWGAANAQVMTQAASLAEQVAPADANAAQWEQLMAAVVKYATA